MQINAAGKLHKIELISFLHHSYLFTPNHCSYYRLSRGIPEMGRATNQCRLRENPVFSFAEIFPPVLSRSRAESPLPPLCLSFSLTLSLLSLKKFYPASRAVSRYRASAMRKYATSFHGRHIDAPSLFAPPPPQGASAS